jgi:hypothetical protein
VSLIGHLLTMSIYYITNASRDNDGVITTLRAAKDSQAATGVVMRKSEMVAKLTAGDSARTWNRGKSEEVRVVDGKYLRTDANGIKADNLGDLPPV